MKKEKYETLLPIFPGYYCTIFEADEEPMIKDGKTWDDYDWDYKEYYERVAQECTYQIEHELQSILGDKNININFKELISPKYYNYSNDSINIEVLISKEGEKKILELINKNIEQFKVYLKENYTSHDGYASFHDNTPETWLLPFDELNKVNHKISAFLEFILLEVEGYDQWSLYENCSSENYINCTLKKLKLCQNN